MDGVPGKAIESRGSRPAVVAQIPRLESFVAACAGCFCGDDENGVNVAERRKNIRSQNFAPGKPAAMQCGHTPRHVQHGHTNDKAMATAERATAMAIRKCALLGGESLASAAFGNWSVRGPSATLLSALSSASNSADRCASPGAATDRPLTAGLASLCADRPLATGLATGLGRLCADRPLTAGLGSL